MDTMQSQLQLYVHSRFAGRQGTPRLGFTTEKEIFNIFKKVFGSELFSQKLVRKVMAELFECIKLFRNIQTVPNNTDGKSDSKIKEINKIYPVYVLTAHTFFKLAMFCQGKALFSICSSGETNCCAEHTNFQLQKAVFDGNLHFLARLADML